MKPMKPTIPLQELVDYCIGKPDSEISFPFGDVPVCFKHRGKIFIEIYPNADDFKITVRCEPAAGERCRARYPGIVVPGYHVPLRQRMHKITIFLNKGLSKHTVLDLIDRSYDTLET